MSTETAEPVASQEAQPAPAPPVPPAAPTEFKESLNEFCTRLSGRDRRVELIAAFAHTERIAGRLRDLPSAYSARFAACATRRTV